MARMTTTHQWGAGPVIPDHPVFDLVPVQLLRATGAMVDFDTATTWIRQWPLFQPHNRTLTRFLAEEWEHTAG